jgi:hypothetical protein
MTNIAAATLMTITLLILASVALQIRQTETQIELEACHGGH